MQWKKKPFLTVTNRIFQSLKNRTLCFTPEKYHFLRYLDLIKIRLKILLSNFAEKKETFFDLKNRIFQTPKNRTFSKGIDNPCFWSKNGHYLVYLDLVKIRLAIMLNYIEERKETFLTMKNRIFKSSKHGFFWEGLTHAFG